MVYGMVQRHGAELEIDSELGRGTTMRLTFPVRTPRILLHVTVVRRPGARKAPAHSGRGRRSGVNRIVA